MNRIISIIFLFIIALHVKATDVEWPHVIPRTPSVSALEKFGDYPIGYNTGTVSIGVPLFNFALDKGVALNISLDYHSSGIKVSDVCGRVGTGWALNAGGVISREIRGQRDECGFYNFIQSHKGYQLPDRHGFQDIPELLDSINRGAADLEPDLFYLTLPSGSYKFFLGNDGEFHTIPYSNLKVVRCPLNSIAASGDWVILDESGNRYIFGRYNGQLAIDQTFDHNRITTTAWKLLAIVSPENKELATFSYKDTDYKNPKVNHRVYKFEDSQLFPYYGEVNSIKSHLGEFSYSNAYKFSSSDLTGIHIPGIGNLSFHSSNQGSLLTSHIIDKITYTSSINGKQTSYDLSYDDIFRIYLSGIQKSGSDGTSVKYRSFEYYDNLPTSVNSYAQDYWGYYNGANNNTNLYTTEDYIYRFNKLPSTSLGGTYMYEYSNRYPTEDAKAGSLKKIIYPTGGSTVFEYEGNCIYSKDSTYTTYSKNENAMLSQSVNSSSTFHTGLYENLKYDIQFSIQSAGVYTTRIQLVDSTGGIWFDKEDYDLAMVSTREGESSMGYPKFEYKSSFLLPAGSYQWKITIESDKPRLSPSIVEPVNIYYSYYAVKKSITSVGSVTYEKLVGGIRIKKITDYDSDQSVIEERNYSYLGPDGKCSGKGAPKPFFIRHYIENVEQPPRSDVSLQAKYYTGIEEIGEESLLRYTGSAVLYSYVTEDRNVGGKTYRIDYSYGNRDYICPEIYSNTFGYEQSPFPYDQNEYMEGLLKSKTIYKSEGNRFVPIQKECYTYDVIEGNRFQHVPAQTCVSLTNMFDIYGEEYHRDQRYYYGTYKLISAKVLPVQTKVMTFLGGDTLTTTTNTTYNNDTYIQPSGTVRYTDEGNNAVTAYKYSYDSNDAVCGKMTERNMVSAPVSVKTSYKGAESLLSTGYGYFTAGSDTLIEPSSITRTCKGETSGIEYLKYDLYGNPLHVSMNGVAHRYYLWSYRGKLPIAEIIGGYSSESEVESAVMSVFGKNMSALSEDSVPDRTKLLNGSLQKLLPKAKVSTFTFDNEEGVATVTGPNGITQRYEYDDFGRLVKSIIAVMKSDGTLEDAIKETYKYHYQTQAQ